MYSAFHANTNHVHKMNYGITSIVTFMYMVSPDHSRFCVHLIYKLILIINILIIISINDLAVALKRLTIFYFSINKYSKYVTDEDSLI